MKIKPVLLYICVLLVLTGCKDRIVHDLLEHEANRVITSLNDVGINVSKEKQGDGKWTIVVPNKSAMAALKHLSSTRAFAVRRAKKVNTSSVVSSREDRQFQYERALSAEIESTLLSIAGVFDARVHLNIAPRDPVFGHPLTSSFSGSASVLLIVTPKLVLEKAHIARLVHGASGVPADSISVLISHGAEIPDMTSATVEQVNTAESIVKGSFPGSSLSTGAFQLLTPYHRFLLPLCFVVTGALVLWKLSPF